MSTAPAVPSEAYLSNKHSILSSGGTKFTDLYYNGMNSSASLVECTYSMGKYTQTLSSKSFGSTSNVNIPNQGFLGETFLILELQDLEENQCVCKGWGLAIIESISYILGSTNTSTITLSGESLWSVLTAQCMDAEKRSEIFSLAGQEYLESPETPLGQDAPKLRAYVPLVFPWSYMCDRLPLDVSMLSNNIVISIKFKSANAIYGGTGDRPPDLKNASITFRQGDLSNTALSISNTLKQHPDMIYAYPMMHFQSFQSPPFDGSKETQRVGGCTVNLTGFINSDLVGIMFYVVKQTDIVPDNFTAPSPFNTARISNIRLTYNGIPIYVADGELYRLVNMIGHQSASYWTNMVIKQDRNTDDFESVAVNSYLCYIDFSRLRSACFASHFPNTFRISNQTLQLTFNTPLGSPTKYVCYGTYCYSGVCEFQQGVSFIYFD